MQYRSIDVPDPLITHVLALPREVYNLSMAVEAINYILKYIYEAIRLTGQ
jgi:hypothetical protein